MAELTKLELESTVHRDLATLDDDAYAAALYVVARDLAFMYDEYLSERVRDLTGRTVRHLRQRATGAVGPESGLADEWEAVCVGDDEDGPSGCRSMMLTFREAVDGVRAREELDHLTGAVGGFPTVADLWATLRLDNPDAPADETEYGVRMLRRLESALPTIAALTVRGLDPETIRSEHLPPPPQPPNLLTAPTLEQYCIALVGTDQGTLADLVLEFVASLRWAMMGQRSPVTELPAAAARAAVTRLRPLVEQLAAEGRLELYEPTGAAGELRRVAGRSIGQALADPAAWQAHGDGAPCMVHLLTTDSSAWNRVEVRHPRSD
jgi:hypothetical protein